MSNETQKNNFFYHICGGCYYGRNDNRVAEFHDFVRSFIYRLGSGNVGMWLQAPHLSRRDGLNVSGFLGGCALNNDRKNDAGFGFTGGRGFTSSVFYSICGG